MSKHFGMANTEFIASCIASLNRLVIFKDYPLMSNHKRHVPSETLI